MPPKKKATKKVAPTLTPLAIQCDQGSLEWKRLRAGRVTASRVSDVMARLKGGGEAAKRRDYKIEIVTETLTGEPCDDLYQTPDMGRGVMLEPVARVLYAERYGVDVAQVGFVLHPDISQGGASPDGLIGTDGLLEIKCPRSYNHIDYILAGVVPEQYRNQMLWQMECTDRKWCDFVSFDPLMPDHLKLFVIRFHRDEGALANIRAEVRQFITEVNELVAKLTNITKD